MADAMFDVAVCGGGPAGATAAIMLARMERSVVLVDRGLNPESNATCVWLSSRAAPLLESLGIQDKKIFADSFADVTFHNADFSKTIKPKFEGPAGYLLIRGELTRLLLDTARDAGVTVVEEAEVTDLKLEESRVVLKFDGRKEIESRLLVVATGRNSPMIRECGFRIGTSAPVLWAARVDEKSGKGKRTAPDVHVVLGLNKAGSFGMVCHRGDALSVSAHWVGDRREATPALINLCKMAADHGVISVDLAREAASENIHASPASAALDYDSHVGKHSLLIGDAGGFVSAASNEGIFPAMWSASIASGVINAALNETYTQDELMSFDAKWRIEMADYLRSPNTDPQFLLPLVFSNQAMADRMGAAFFCGENI